MEGPGLMAFALKSHPAMVRFTEPPSSSIPPATSPPLLPEKLLEVMETEDAAAGAAATDDMLAMPRLKRSEALEQPEKVKPERLTLVAAPLKLRAVVPAPLAQISFEPCPARLTSGPVKLTVLLRVYVPACAAHCTGRGGIT